MRCKYCGHSFKPKSNETIRTLARYYLSLSLPFATCSDANCPNYGINVFEKYARVGSPYPRHYRKQREDTAFCRSCESNVTVGVSRALRRSPKAKTAVRTILTNVQLGVKKRRTVHFAKMSSGAYYSRLHRIGARLQDFHSWLNVQLLDPRAKVDFSDMARVYTDVADITLRRMGDVTSFRFLKVIVSVLAIKKTYYILAVHPYFLPARYGPAPEDNYYDPETGWPSDEFAQKWACIEHPVHNRFEDTSKKTHAGQADVSRFGQGFYVRPAYAEAAHFLVVLKMLQRFERVCFYMDNARDLVPSAMVSMADQILDKKVEVVLFQRSYRARGRPQRPATDMGAMGSESRLKALRKCWEQTEQRVRKTFEEGMGAKHLGNDPADPERRAASAFTRATRGAFSSLSEWAWLRFPAPMGNEKECRSLWLTRIPGKTFEEARDPLLYATLQPVDAAIAALRSRVLSMGRPGSRARPGRSFNERYVNPKTVMSEISIYLLGRNYSLMSADQEVIPACELGLMPTGRKPIDLVATFENFRLGLSHAEKISQWLRR